MLLRSHGTPSLADTVMFVAGRSPASTCSEWWRLGQSATRGQSSAARIACSRAGSTGLRSGLLSRRSPRLAPFTGWAPWLLGPFVATVLYLVVAVCSWPYWPSTKPGIVTTDRASPSQSALLRYRKPTRTRGRSGQCESSQHGRTQLEELVPAATRCVRPPTCQNPAASKASNDRIARASASSGRPPAYRRSTPRLAARRRGIPATRPSPLNRALTEMGRRVTENVSGLLVPGVSLERVER